MEFHGDIIITDPCYIMRSGNDWADCDFGDRLSELGIETFLTSDGGDSVGQTVRDCDSGEILGTFCTDSGMVSVMLLKEVVAYHPHYNQKLAPRCYTIVKDFAGEIHRSEIENDENQHWGFFATGNRRFRTDAADES